MNTEEIIFKKLELAHLRQMSEWLATTEVKRWYPVADTSYNGVLKKYSPAINGSEPISGYIVSIQGTDIGYVQTYWHKDFPNPKLAKLVPLNTAGLDIFVGDDRYRGKGIGQRILRRFLIDIVFTEKGAKHCLVDPSPLNIAAVNAYKKVGFEEFQLVDANCLYLIAHATG